MSGAGPLRVIVAAALAPLQPAGRTLCCALSGGRDSTLLFVLLHELAVPLGFRLSALHVHHGLSPRADDWARHCQGLCERLGVALQVRRVQVPRRGADGLEAAARAERYRCYRDCGAEVVVLAHHADDQAETVLLQLLRGAGPEGLAAMPALRRLGPDGPWLARPLLEVPRARIEAGLRDRGLSWVEDESNADTRRARNHLRHAVMPVLEQLQPAVREVLARSARNMADAAALAAAVGREDVARAADGPGLRVDALRALPAVRAANALRQWLADAGLQAPPRERLLAGLAQLLEARSDGAPRLMLGEQAVLRHQGCLMVARPAAAGNWWLPWNGELRLALPDGRTLHLDPREGTGLSRARLLAAGVRVRLRRGGERLRPGPGRPHRTLKNLLREAGVPPWERSHAVVLEAGGRTAWAEGAGGDAGFAAAPGEAGVEPMVLPGPAGTGR